MKGLGADGPYWAALNEGQLKLQQCSGCNKWNWPAVYHCGECGSWEHEWKPVAMSGKVFSWTRSWHDFGGPDELKPPFVTVVVELDGADHTRLIGLLDQADADVRIGLPVTGKVRSVTFNGESLPVIEWSLQSGGAQ